MKRIMAEGCRGSKLAKIGHNGADFRTDVQFGQHSGQLQREVEALRPIDYDEMNEAADLIQYFGDYWDSCEEMDNPAEARQRLLQKIVDQVFVYNDQVIVVVLHGNFSVVLDSGEDDMPEELASVLKQNGCAIIFNDAQPGRKRRASHSHIPPVVQTSRHSLLLPGHSPVHHAPCALPDGVALCVLPATPLARRRKSGDTTPVPNMSVLERTGCHPSTP